MIGEGPLGVKSTMSDGFQLTYTFCSRWRVEFLLLSIFFFPNSSCPPSLSSFFFFFLFPFLSLSFLSISLWSLPNSPEAFFLSEKHLVSLSQFESAQTLRRLPGIPASPFSPSLLADWISFSARSKGCPQECLFVRFEFVRSLFVFESARPKANLAFT